MQKTSIITGCQFQREWQSPNGTLYFHTVSLENGDFGDIATKTQNPEHLEKGKELTYTIEHAGDYQGMPKYRIKAVQAAKPYSGGGGGGNKYSSPQSIRTMCLSYAKDMAVAGKILPNELLDEAQRYVNWVNAESK